MNQTANQQHRRKVLVLGADARMLLPIARSLGRRGIDVHLAWCPAEVVAVSSRYVKAVHELPPCSNTDSRWRDALTVLHQQEQYDLILPATEPAVFAIQDDRAYLEPRLPIFLLEQHTFDTVFDKVASTRLAKSLNIPVPQSAVVQGLAEFDRLADHFHGPVVLKPVQSIDQSAPTGKNFVRLFESLSDCRNTIARELNHNQTHLVQQAVSGSGVGIDLLARNGRILFAFQHERIHETTGHGSTYRRSVPLENHLLDAAQKLITALNYDGVAMVEFRVDRATGEWVFLEINGRFWGSLPLASAAEADFPWLLYRMLSDGETEFPQNYRIGVRCRSFRSDLRWTWRKIIGKQPNGDGQNESAGWGLNERSLWRVLADTLRLFSGLDHIDTFTWDDPRPFLAELRQLAGSSFSHLTRWLIGNKRRPQPVATLQRETSS